MNGLEFFFGFSMGIFICVMWVLCDIDDSE